MLAQLFLVTRQLAVDEDSAIVAPYRVKALPRPIWRQLKVSTEPPACYVVRAQVPLEHTWGVPLRRDGVVG